jgi:3-dehydroquinate dehydratase
MPSVKKETTKSKKQINDIEVSYHFDSTESPEEIQRRVDEAFAVIFESVYKNYWIKLKQNEKDQK